VQFWFARVGRNSCLSFVKLFARFLSFGKVLRFGFVCLDFMFLREGFWLAVALGFSVSFLSNGNFETMIDEYRLCSEVSSEGKILFLNWEFC
jgi:hypothetical protein